MVEICDQLLPDHTVDCILADYREATTAAMTHLLALGHRRIAMVFGVDIREMALDRLEPYQEGLAAAGLPLEPGAAGRVRLVH